MDGRVLSLRGERADERLWQRFSPVDPEAEGGGPGTRGKNSHQALMTMFREAARGSGHKLSCYRTQVTKRGGKLGDTSPSDGCMTTSCPPNVLGW